MNLSNMSDEEIWKRGIDLSFEKYPEYRTMCTAPDGHIYSFPWIEQLGSGKEAIQAIGDIPYINKKWLDYLGLEIPTTTDELEQVLIQFRDHADELEKEFSIEGAVIPISPARNELYSLLLHCLQSRCCLLFYYVVPVQPMGFEECFYLSYKSSLYH